MKIGIIGAKGFVGSEIYKRLGKDHKVYPIYQAGGAGNKRYYDIVVDANGSSRKYLAEEEPWEDFKKSVESVAYYTMNLNCGKYIYLSSIDAEIPGETNYGFHRKMAEKLVKNYCNRWTIVRLCSVIGPRATKGVVYDILNDKELFVTKNSELQLISAKEVAQKLVSVLTKYDYEILKFYSTDVIKVSRICSMFGKDSEISPYAEVQVYNWKGSDLGFKKSVEYLKDEFHERMV